MARRFDLLIAGGTVIDPGSALHARRDIGVADGKIVAIGENLQRQDAAQVIEADHLIVTPGLIDFHVHAYVGVNMYGIDIDDVCTAGGVTTAIDAGSSGAVNFPGFRRYIAEPARARVLAFVCIAKHGVMHGPGELVDLSFADVEGTTRAVNDHRDVAVGVKVRVAQHHVHANGPQALDLAIEAGEATNTPVMVHIGNSEMSIEEIATALRPGDVITHCFTPLEPTIVGSDGKPLAEILDAQTRGVRFDIGHARRHLDFSIARTSIDAGLAPDFISTDIHLNPAMSELVSDLPSVLSKFLALGMGLDEVIATATNKAADAIGWGDRIGHLAVGREADIAVLALQDAPMTFFDSVGAGLESDRCLEARWTIRAGRALPAAPLVPPAAHGRPF